MLNFLGFNLEKIFETAIVIMLALGYAYMIFKIIMSSILIARAITPKVRKNALTQLIISIAVLILLIVLSFSVDLIVSIIF
jgi:uncharacterized membrane protein